MKTYNVKEVAKMMNTSEETVRRWIRSGKLNANMDSRKEGSVITEVMLKEFIKGTPKYAAILTTPVGGIVAASTLILSTLIAKSVDKNEAIKRSQVDSEELKKMLLEKLTSSKEAIKRKKKTVAQLETEIREEEEEIQSIKHLIKEIWKNIDEDNDK